MVILLMIIVSFWNAFAVKDDLNQGTAEEDQKASDIWHSIGWWQRAIIWGAGVSIFIPEVGIYIFNPAFLMEGWWGVIFTASLLGWIGVFIYKIPINLVNGWDWRNMGKGKKMSMKYAMLMLTWGALTVMWGLIGFYIIEAIKH